MRESCSTDATNGWNYLGSVDLYTPATLPLLIVLHFFCADFLPAQKKILKEFIYLENTTGKQHREIWGGGGLQVFQEAQKRKTSFTAYTSVTG